MIPLSSNLWLPCRVSAQLRVDTGKSPAGPAGLLPYSVAYSETGVLTPGYLLYAVIGILFSTPGPFVASLILALFIERNGLKSLMRGIFRTERKLETICICGFFCVLALVYALLFGTPNGAPWYMFIGGLVIMIPFVGIAEETAEEPPAGPAEAEADTAPEEPGADDGSAVQAQTGLQAEDQLLTAAQPTTTQERDGGSILPVIMIGAGVAALGVGAWYGWRYTQGRGRRRRRRR